MLELYAWQLGEHEQVLPTYTTICHFIQKVAGKGFPVPINTPEL